MDGGGVNRVGDYDLLINAYLHVALKELTTDERINKEKLQPGFPKLLYSSSIIQHVSSDRAEDSPQPRPNAACRL